MLKHVHRFLRLKPTQTHLALFCNRYIANGHLTHMTFMTRSVGHPQRWVGMKTVIVQHLSFESINTYKNIKYISAFLCIILQPRLLAQL